jgi:hypothetical protein
MVFGGGLLHRLFTSFRGGKEAEEVCARFSATADSDAAAAV